MWDITKNKDALDTLNAIINNRGIAEVKVESKGITIVEIKRTMKYKDN